MLRVHPLVRLSGALLVMVAIFLTTSMAGVVLIYTLTLLLALMSRVVAHHLRYVAFITMPMLSALLILWGWVIDSRHIALPNGSGVEYAFFLWLRIVSWGGMLQFLFVPLVENPAHLNGFLRRTGLGGPFGTLIIVSLTFLPEMRRRLAQIIDARRAQGAPLRGLQGLWNLPALLMPLISSLLDSATKRAEFWSHRGILGTVRSNGLESDYSLRQSAFLFMLSIVSVIIAVLT